MYEEMVRQGLSEFPNEACGQILGRDGSPERLVPMKNADASPVTYRFDSDEQFKVWRRCQEEGLDDDPYAIYHSHTHSEAYPSQTDVEKAVYPDSYWLILSLEDRGRPVLRGFRIDDGEVTEEEVKIR